MTPLFSGNSGISQARHRLSYRVTVAFRILFFIAVVFVLDSVLKPGTSPVLLSIATTAGVVFSSRISFSRLRTSGFVLILAGMHLAFFVTEWLVCRMPSLTEDSVFAAYNTLEHFRIALLAFSIAALTTWFFWRFRYFLSVELLIFIFVFVELLSAHRDYRFDAPLIINSLSWDLGIDQLLLLVWLGAAAASSMLLYFFFTTLPERPMPTVSNGHVIISARRNPFSTLAAATITALLLFLIGHELYRHYSQAALTRIAEGVGQETQEGLSPLGFHSALGSTNQPAALVRLEGDYKENPFSPMLYLRETALSRFNGHELVIASHQFDQDVPYISPSSEYGREEDKNLQDRKSLTQSVYLLADHKNAFAVDYPVTLRQLRNPNAKRFRGAFQAISIVPAFSFDSLANAPLGNPAWDEATVKLYLEEHPDPRYKELAMKIAGAYFSPLEKAKAITDWLSKNATYTLTPNHEVKPEDDPVAPFLFGDLRGYCVHFAHSMVYLFRAMGIPARIGTGYLTDLSQSKDGHILLRMSDRHAWAEVYVQNRGWIPFDVQPEHVESHAETQVDARLLEELMQMLDPSESLLPPDVIQSEQDDGLASGQLLPLPTRLQVFASIGFLVFASILLKLFILTGWRIKSPLRVRSVRGYRAASAFLLDLGIERSEGETRKEFAVRVQQDHGINFKKITDSVDRATYAGPATPPGSPIESVMREYQNSLWPLKWWKKAAAWCNPSSIFRYLGRGRW